MARYWKYTLFAFIISLSFWSMRCANVNLTGLNPDDYKGTTITPPVDPDIGPMGPTNPFALIDCSGVDETFSTQVEPIFSANCVTGGCHTGSMPAAGVPLNMMSEQTASTLPISLQSSRGVNNANFFQSTLLLAPLATDQGGTASHTGGKLFQDSNDSDFKTLYCWLEGGLANDLNDSDHNFGDDILPIFSQCTGCHNGGQIPLDLRLTTPRQMHALVTGSNYLTPNDPSTSTIYTKPTGNGHGGGQIFNATSSQAMALEAWINNGAPAD